MKALSSRQFYYILILSMISLKFMALPSLLYASAGSDGFLVVLFLLIIEFFFFWLFLTLICKYPNQTFDQLTEKKFGKVVSKVFFAFIGIYFLIKSVIAIEGVHAFFKENLFEDLQAIIFIVPMFSILFYLTKKGLNCLGRVLEIIFYFIVVGLVLSLILSLFSINLENVLPFLENGFSPIFNAMFKYNFWFGDFLILTLLMGRIKQSGKFKRNTIIIWSLTAFFLVFFTFVFIAIFGNVASYHRLAISDLAQYSYNYTTNIQIDWLPILLWTLGLFYQCAIGFWFATKSFVNAINKKAENWIIVLISAITIIFLTIIYFDVNKIVILASEYVNIFSLFIYFIAFLFGVLCFKKRRENGHSFKKNF